MIEAARGKAVETAALLETVEKRLRGCRSVKPRPVFPPLPQGLENASRVSHSSHRFYYWDKTKPRTCFRKERSPSRGKTADGFTTGCLTSRRLQITKVATLRKVRYKHTITGRF
jgi:hypothetical protein